MNLVNKIIIKLSCNKVGADEFGNTYFEKKLSRKQKQASDKNHAGDNSKSRRFVVYNGQVEASKIPATWHSWLHYSSNNPPNVEAQRKPWQKIHLPNLTGTIYQNSPASCVDKKDNRKKVSADYEAWSPNNSN